MCLKQMYLTSDEKVFQQKSGFRSHSSSTLIILELYSYSIQYAFKVSSRYCDVHSL